MRNKRFISGTVDLSELADNTDIELVYLKIFELAYNTYLKRYGLSRHGYIHSGWCQ
jgi:hypothetical protein